MKDRFFGKLLDFVRSLVDDLDIPENRKIIIRQAFDDIRTLYLLDDSSSEIKSDINIDEKKERQTDQDIVKSGSVKNSGLNSKNNNEELALKFAKNNPVNIISTNYKQNKAEYFDSLKTKRINDEEKNRVDQLQEIQRRLKTLQSQ